MPGFTGDSPAGGTSPGGEAAVDEQRLVCEPKVLEVARCIAIGGCDSTRERTAQRVETDSFLMASPVWGDQVPIQEFPAPEQLRTHHDIESQRPADRWHIQVGARAQQRQPCTLRAMTLDRSEEHTSELQ